VFNYLYVNFPNTSVGPQVVSSLNLYQNRYEHEVVSIKFRDWGVPYEAVETGSPISFTIGFGADIRDFYGYVHHINLTREPGHNVTEVVAVGASMIMKNESQQVYKGMSADGIIQQIAKRNNFVCFSVPHPRIYPQVAQAGHTDWELCVKLAKQSGYSLRTQNTELYFQPMLYEYTTARYQAPVYTMNVPTDPNGSNLYSFEPVIAESLEYDGDKKGAVAVGGVDRATTQSMSITQQTRAKNTKSNTKPEFFDRFATHVVARDAATAQYEAEAAENRNIFPYRATAEVLGSATLRPDLPIYIVGAGSQYDGYWTILGTEHRVVEKNRNVQMYTTVLTLGSDSLGTAAQWVDGNTVTAPTPVATRALTPGVTQVAVVPVTNLKVTAPTSGALPGSSFSVATNRPASNASSPVWVTGTASLDPLAQSSTTATAPNRLLNSVVLGVL